MSVKNLIGALVLGLVIYICRFIPHPENFTPMLALCLGVGFFTRGHWYGFLIPIVAMFLGDLQLGFYPGWAFTYIPLVAAVAFGFLSRARSLTILGIGLSSSIVFFMISNFGVWLSAGLYPPTVEGIFASYAAGLPFFFRTLMGTWFYSAIIFSMIYGVLNLKAQEVPQS